MTEKKAITHTESRKKRPVHLEIKFRVEKFEPLMKSYKPGEDLWSEGVTSKPAPRIVWKLRTYPNGQTEQYKGNVSVFLHLTGPMVDSKESLDATYHIYLVDGSNGNKIDVVERGTKNFGKGHSASGWDVDHARVKKALRPDGSLLLAADVEFLVPDDDYGGDGGVESNCKASALRGDETQKQPGVKFSSEPHSEHASSDPTAEIEKRSIEKVLSAENVVMMALLPDTKSLETLKKACIELIVHKGKTVFESAAWKELIEAKPELAAQLAVGAAALLAAEKK